MSGDDKDVRADFRYENIKTYEDLQHEAGNALSGIGCVLEDQYELPPHAALNMVVTVKHLMFAYADHYHRLMAAGKVPEDCQIRVGEGMEHWVGEAPQDER